MSEHRPGQWPVPNSVDFSVDVRLVLTVDLNGRYDHYREVSDHLREQTQRNVDCHTVIVRIGPDAVRHGMELGRNIAATFYLSASRIEIHVPAGNDMGAFIHGEVSRYVRLYQADHERMTATSKASG